MITHNTKSPSTGERRPPFQSSSGGRRNCNHAIGRHGPVHSKLSDELREYLADQPRLVLIGVNGTAQPFFHLPFHEPLNSEGCQYDLPR